MRAQAISHFNVRENVLMKILVGLLLLVSPLSAEPWGKDSDLVYRVKSEPKKTIETPIFGPFGEMMIGFHQNVISPCDGPRSHFYPSSSQYTLDAMRKYGFFKGFVLGCDRLLRENNEEWVYQKEPTGLKLNPVR